MCTWCHALLAGNNDNFDSSKLCLLVAANTGPPPTKRVRVCTMSETKDAGNV